MEDKEGKKDKAKSQRQKEAKNRKPQRKNSIYNGTQLMRPRKTRPNIVAGS